MGERRLIEAIRNARVALSDTNNTHLPPGRDGTLGAGTTQKEVAMSNTQHPHIIPAVLRRKDAAVYLGVCVNTLGNMKDMPGFPRPIRVTQRSVGYRKADLDAWLENRQA